MKNTILKFTYIFLLFFSLTNCNNDDDDMQNITPNYSDVTLNYIQAKESLLSVNNVTTTNSTGIIWQPNTYVLFKTNSGIYGKFKVVSIDALDNYALYIDVVLYNNNGNINSSINNLKIRGTYLCDLDTLTESSTNADFHWSRETNTLTEFKPKNGAKYYVQLQ